MIVALRDTTKLKIRKKKHQLPISEILLCILQVKNPPQLNAVNLSEFEFNEFIGHYEMIRNDTFAILKYPVLRFHLVKITLCIN